MPVSWEPGHYDDYRPALILGSSTSELNLFLAK